MKHQREGQAKVIPVEELNEILETAEIRFGLKYKTLFAVAYYTGCRISEALKLKWGDITKNHIIFRASTTKTKDNRQVPISTNLRPYLEAYRPQKLDKNAYVFPGKTNHLTIKSADKNLRWICDYCGFEGISTHSFRRTAMTRMYQAGVPLSAIQEFTGHKDFNELRRYLEHDENAVVNAVELL